MRTITGRFFAAFAVASAMRMLVPTEAMAQQSQAPGPPVTTAPATEATAGPNAGGELQKVTVTGYLIPRIGDGPQPVTTLDQDFITKQADQTVSDVIARLPEAVGSLNPVTTAGNSFSPAEQAVGLKGLPLQRDADAGRWNSISGCALREQLRHRWPSQLCRLELFSDSHRGSD